MPTHEPMNERSDPSGSLEAAQAAYDEGRYEVALNGARAHGGDAQPAALRLRCLAAFRLGEYDEAASVALQHQGVAQAAAGTESTVFDVLAVSVIAAGELARFDQSIEHLQLVQSAAARAGSLADFVRGRGTAATCFALLGDPWAAQRVLSELMGLFQAGSPERKLESSLRINHVSVCLHIARLARQGGDEAACEEAIDHAAASLERAHEIARDSGDQRVAAFSDVHAAELSMLRGAPDAALALLVGVAAQADAAGLWAHARQLRLLEAEALLAHGDAAAARVQLDIVGARLNEGHEIASRIRYHGQMQRVLGANGEAAASLEQLEKARVLAQFRQYRQSLAQSRYLRVRLELEHMYRFRPGGRSRSSRPGPLSTG
jgi:hypothetical protein